MRPVILIPAYKPSRQLIDIARGITGHEYELIIVNDGSGEAFQSLFNEIAQIKHVTLLEHAVNLGKGEALKTGFNYFLNHFKQHPGIVTADADGQHLIPDIINLAETLERTPNTLHLGARAFKKDVPFRSQFGNILTRHIFRLLLGTKLQDTQTGLRGIPRAFLPILLQTKSRGYDFELDMLVLAHRHHIPIQETLITTVYENNNQSSHFNPLWDSLKIYYVFFRFTFFALISGLLDFLAFTVTFFFIPHIFFAESLARVFSGTCNFWFNKGLVFKSREAILYEALKYTLLCVVNLGFSYSLISGLVYLGVNVHMSKLTALLCLFFANFAIQKLFIFSESEVEPPFRTE